MKKLLGLTVSMALLAAGAAWADVADVQWNAEGKAEREFTVAPGKFAEWCTRLGAGQAVRWEYEASAPLDFNVHFHEGKDVRFPQRMGGVARAQGAISAATPQDYCWMWSSKSAEPIRLKASLAKQ